MSREETEIYEFLKRFPNQFVSVGDISKSVGSRRQFNEDRNWTLPVLRRMALHGWVEVSTFGEFRVTHQPEETTTFKKALETPGASLGDTAIICIDDIREKRA
jgi:hypothetical protein